MGKLSALMAFVREIHRRILFKGPLNADLLWYFAVSLNKHIRVAGDLRHNDAAVTCAQFRSDMPFYSFYLNE